MSSLTLSVILYAALHSGQSCEAVFQHAAYEANAAVATLDEQTAMKRLAAAACQTNNPDIIWQIIQTESNFRFAIVRINGPRSSVVLQGRKALRYAESLPPSAANVDMGAMQLNWTWHRHEFENNPRRMLEPVNQVNYLLERFGDSMYRLCSGKWVGCYHNPTRPSLARSYEKIVRSNGRLLGAISLGFAISKRMQLSAEEQAALPPIRNDDYEAVLKRAQELPLPRLELFSVAQLLQLDPVKVIFKMDMKS